MSFDKFKNGPFKLVGLIKGTDKYNGIFSRFSDLSRQTILPLHIFMTYMAIWLTSRVLSLIIPEFNFIYVALKFQFLEDILQIMTVNPIILFGGIIIVCVIHELGHSFVALGLKKEVLHILCVGTLHNIFPVVVTNIKGDEKDFTPDELMSIYNGGNLIVFIVFSASTLMSLVLGPTPILSTFVFSALALLAFNIFPFPGTDTWQIARAKLNQIIANKKKVKV